MLNNKRFYMDKSGDLYDEETNDVFVDFGYSFDSVGCKRVIDLLNSLNEENRLKKEEINQLIQRNKSLQKSINDFIKVEEENETFKKEISHLKTVIRRCEYSSDIKSDSLNNLHLDYLKLEKENKDLKNNIKSLLEEIQGKECLKNKDCFKVFNKILVLVE